MKNIALALTLGLLLLSGSSAFASGDYEDDHGWVVGSGDVQTENRDVPSFTAIDLEGSGDVTIRQSAFQGVSVEADENVLPLVKTEVVDGVLHLGFVRGAHVTHLTRLSFSVAAPRVDGITISGSGNARTATSVRTDDMRLEIRGSGNIDCDTRASTLNAAIGGSGGITVRGRVDQVSVTIDGSGSVRAHELKSSDASVRVNGSGDAMIYATDTVNISIAGSGSVLYGGGARATVRSSGSGTAKEY
jgi:hypothetical protein